MACAACSCARSLLAAGMSSSTEQGGVDAVESVSACSAACKFSMILVLCIAFMLLDAIVVTTCQSKFASRGAGAQASNTAVCAIAARSLDRPCRIFCGLDDVYNCLRIFLVEEDVILEL